MRVSAPRHAIALGASVAFISASFFGFVTPLARLAYDSGANPTTATLLRMAFGAAAAVALALVLGRGWALPRAAYLPTLGVTACLGLAAVFYLGSVAFIPVSLAVLLFYLYPLMVAAYVTIVQGVPLGTTRTAAFVIAFAGLAIAFGPSHADLDWLGVGLAVTAAVLLAGLFVFSEAALCHTDVVTVALYSNVGCVPFLALGIALFGAPAWPAADAGWIALMVSGTCYACGMLLNFAAIGLAGPSRAAMIFNAEPVVAMGVAAALLGESLSVVQYVGAALVIAGLALSGLAGPRKEAA